MNELNESSNSISNLNNKNQLIKKEPIDNTSKHDQDKSGLIKSTTKVRVISLMKSSNEDHNEYNFDQEFNTQTLKSMTQT